MGWLRARCKQVGRELAVDEHDLKALWDAQQGLCPYTGWQMMLPDKQARPGKPLIKHPARASLDRIDSSKGYVPDNVRVVCWMYNAAKQDWSDADVMMMLEALWLKSRK